MSFLFLSVCKAVRWSASVPALRKLQKDSVIRPNVEGNEFYSWCYIHRQFSSLSDNAESYTCITSVVFLFLVIANCKSSLSEKWKTSALLQSSVSAAFEFSLYCPPGPRRSFWTLLDEPLQWS